MNRALIVAVIALLAGRALAETPEDLYAQGQDAYDRKIYGEAIERWKASYRMSNEEALFFNIAQAQRLSGDCHGAIESYRRYMTSNPDPASEQHKLANDFTRDLERTCPPLPKPDVAPVLALDAGSGRSSEVTNDQSNDQPSAPSGGRTLRIAGLVTGGASILVLATGLYLGHSAQAIGQEVTDACRVSCDWTAWKDKDAKGQRYATIGRGLAFGGAVGLAGGAVLYYLGVRQGALTIEPGASGGGAAVSWSGSW
jgi:hypothetical protein